MNISHYLDKFKKLIKDGNHEYEVIMGVIKETTGLDIPREAITKKNYTLFIKTHPALKSELFMHKASIIEKLKSEGIIISEIN